MMNVLALWLFSFSSTIRRCTVFKRRGFPGGSEVKNLPANDIRDVGSILGSGRSPGEANDSPLQYSCQENPMDRGAWQATVHRVSKNQT